MNMSASSGAVIFVSQLERMQHFYCEVVELTITQAEQDFVVLQREGLELVLHAIPPHIAATFEIADPPLAREDASIKLMFPVIDLAAARAAAARLGGRLLPAEKEWSWRGLRICDGVDPEGNVFRLRAPASPVSAAEP